MFSQLKSLFSGGPSLDYVDLKQRNVFILDVRTPGEFRGGHVADSVNIPLNLLGNQLNKLPKDRPIVACCASGNRSGSTTRMLQSQGFEVYNGGSWGAVDRGMNG